MCGPFPCLLVLAAGNDRAFAERSLANRRLADRSLAHHRRRRSFHVHVGRGGNAGETEDCHCGKNDGLHEGPPKRISRQDLLRQQQQINADALI